MTLKPQIREDFLTLVILSAYPVLLLVAPGSMGVLFFLMALVSIASLIRSGAWRERQNWNPEMTAFALAVALATIAILLAQLYHRDFRWKPYDEAVRLLLAVPIYMVIRGGKTQVTRVFGLAMPAGAILAMIVIGGSTVGVGTQHRFTDHFLSEIHLGNLALMLGFLSLFSIHVGRERSPISITLKLCGFFVGVYLSFRTGTRGGWPVIPVLLVLWIVLSLRLRSRIGMIAALSLLSAVSAAAFLMYDMIQQRLLDVYSDLAAFARGNKDTSIGIRIQILQVVAHILHEHPLFGVGPQGYQAALFKLGQTGMITQEAVGLGSAEVHNQILNYAVKYGMLGLLSGVAIHLMPLIIFVRALKVATGEARVAASMGICLVTGFIIFGLTVEILNLKHTISFYSLTLAALLGAATRRDAERLPTPATPRI